MRLTLQSPSLARRWWAFLFCSFAVGSSAACGEESGQGGIGDEPCAVGQTLCNGVCVTLESDPLNFRTCNTQCGDGSFCSDGVCVTECETEDLECGASCVDPSIDPSHCGGCNQPCGAGETCVEGLCAADVGGTGGTDGVGGAATGAGGAQTESGGADTGTGGSQTGAGGTQLGSSGTRTGSGGSSACFSPSNPNANCEARALLQYLCDLMGTSTLSGQESMMTDSGGFGSARFPSSRDAYIHDRTGRYPALYSSDFGDVYTSNLDQRQDVVDNGIAYAQQGSAIQLHYHMIQPDQPDGAGFDTAAGFDSSNPYPAANIDRILTPGDPLNVEHLRRLDTLAGYLRQIQDAGVAVLWRPYHEMNGGWFWWGQKDRFADLWIQQWDYLTNTHGLNNLLWVFSVNHWSDTGWGDLGPDAYYPGHDYVDVLGVDVYLEYGHNFDRYVHDTLREVGGGRPIAFTENGEMPNIPALSANQPNWVYWATWWGFEGANSGNTDTLYSTNYDDPRVITQDEVSVPSCP